MIQKEAAERILSDVGSKEYSPLNVLWRLLYNGKREFGVPRNSFCPAPHVDSTVISFTRKEGTNLEEATKAFHLANSLFLQRRKTVLNNLKSYCHDEVKAKSVLQKAKIDPMARPEKLSPTQYLSLSRLLNE